MERLGMLVMLRRLLLSVLCAFALSCAAAQGSQRINVRVESFNLSTVIRGGRTDLRNSFTVAGSSVNDPECTVRHLERNGLSCGRVTPQLFPCSYSGPLVFQHFGCRSQAEAVTFQVSLPSNIPLENDSNAIRREDLAHVFSVEVKVLDRSVSTSSNISLALTERGTYRLSFPRELFGRCHYELLTGYRWLRLPLSGTLLGPVNQPIPCGYIHKTELQYAPENGSSPCCDYILLSVHGRGTSSDENSYEVLSLLSDSREEVTLPRQVLNVQQGLRTRVPHQLFSDVLNASTTLKFIFPSHTAGVFSSIETLANNTSNITVSSIEIKSGLLSFVPGSSDVVSSETNYSYTVTDMVGTVLARGVITVHVFARSWDWDKPGQRTNKGLVVLEGGRANLTSKRLDFYIWRKCELIASLRLIVSPRHGSFVLRNGSNILQSAVSINGIRNGSTLVVYSHNGDSSVSDSSVWEIACGSGPVFELWLGVTIIPIDDCPPNLQQIAVNGLPVNHGYASLFHRSLFDIKDEDSGFDELSIVATPRNGTLVKIDPGPLYENTLYPFVRASDPIWRNATEVSQFSLFDMEAERIWYIPPATTTASNDIITARAVDSSVPPNESPPLPFPTRLSPHSPESALLLNTQQPLPEVLQLRALPLHVKAGVFITPYYLYAYSGSSLDPESIVYVLESRPSFGFVCLPSRARCNGSVTQFTQRDINLQRLFYLPHIEQLKSDSFTFSVTLDGVGQAVLNQSHQFVISAIKDKPIGSARTFWVAVGDGRRVAAKFFRPYSQLLSRDVVFNIDSGPFFGSLSVDRVASTNTHFFTFDDLLRNRVWYQHDGVAGECSDVISFTAVNETHNISGNFVVAIRQSTGLQELSVSIHPHTLFSQTNLIFSQDDLFVNGPFCKDFITFTVIRPPLQGALTFTNAAHNTITILEANSTFTARNIDMGMLQYSLLIEGPLTANVSDSFELRAEDPVSEWPGGLSGRVNGEPENGHFRVTIVPSPNVNYTLEIEISSPRPLTWLSDRGVYGYIFTSADINIFNTTLHPSNVIIQVDQSPAFGRIMTNSTQKSLFSVEEVQAGFVWYHLNEHMILEGLFRDTIDLRVFAELDDFVRLGAQHHFAVEWSTIRVERLSTVTSETDRFSRLLVRRTGAIWFESRVLLTTRPQSASPSLQTLTASPDPLLPTNCSSTPDHDQPDHVQPDYCSLSVELKLEPGVSMKEVLVPIVDDAMAEGPEIFVAELSSPVDGVLSSTHSSAVVTILDTEDYAVVSVMGLLPGRTVPCELEVRIEESIGTLVLNLSRHGNLEEEVGVVCYTEEHTAISGRDFHSRSRGDLTSLVTFAPNQTRAQCAVEIINDPQNENSERFFVKLADPQSLVRISDGSSPICVYLNYDPADVPSVYFNSTVLTVQEREDLTVTANFTITRTGSDLDSTTKVFYEAYSKSSDTATMNEDFAAFSGSGCDEGEGVGCAEFAPGQTSVELPLVILPDRVVEGNETFHIVIRRVHYGQARFPEELRVTVLDATQPAVVQFSQAEYTFSETVSWARVDVTRHGYTSNSSQVKCVIKAGSAQPPMDFQPGDTPQGVLFTAGITHASCYIFIRDDSSYEGPESFTVSLTTIGDDISIVLPSNGSTATIIIDDEEDIPVVQFTSANASILEPFSPFPVDAVNVTLALIRTGDLSLSSSLSFSSEGETAIPGTHFTPLAGVVAFQPQESEKFISIPILSNDIASDTSTFLVRLSSSSDAVVNGDGVRVGERDGVRVVIASRPQALVPYFPALPELVSVVPSEEEEELARGSQLFSDLPLLCITPCDVRYGGRTAEFTQECGRQAIDRTLTRYSWELSTDGRNFHEVTLDTVFTSVQSAVLAPLYLSPAHSARCVARAVSSSHTSGYTRTSQPVLLTQHYHQRCEEVEEGDGRRETELQLESYEHFAGGIEDLVKVSISLYGYPNAIPLISSSHLSPSLATHPSSPPSCSTLPPSTSLLLPPPFPPSHPTEQGNSIDIYRHFNGGSCSWNFAVWLPLRELTENCAGELSVGSSDTVQGNLTLTFNSAFISVSSVGAYVVNGSFVITSGHLGFAGSLPTLTPPHYHTFANHSEGYIYTIAVSRIPGKLRIYFYSVALFEGAFHSNRTEELTLLHETDRTQGMKQAWALEKDYPETEELFSINIELSPCRLVSDSVRECTSSIAFPLLLARERVTEDFTPVFEVESFLTLESNFDVEALRSEPQHTIFTHGDVIHAVLTMAERYRPVEGYGLVIVRAQLCSSEDCSGPVHSIVEDRLASSENDAGGVSSTEQLATASATTFNISTGTLPQEDAVMQYYIDITYNLASNSSQKLHRFRPQHTSIHFSLLPKDTDSQPTEATTDSAERSERVYLFAAIAILLTAVVLVAVGCTIVGLMVWITRVKLGLRRKVERMAEEQRSAEAGRKSLAQTKAKASKESEGEGMRRAHSTIGFPTAEKYKPKKKTVSTSSSIVGAPPPASQQKPQRSRSLPNLSLATTKGFFPEHQRRHLGVPMTRVKVLNTQRVRLNSLGVAATTQQQSQAKDPPPPIHRVVNKIAPMQRDYGVNEGSVIKAGPSNELVSNAVCSSVASAKSPEPGSTPNPQL